MSDKLMSSVLVKRLVDHLREEAKENGPLLPSESVLAEELQVGRPQLREALRVLEAFGAIESRQGARRRWKGVNLGEMTALGAQLSGSPRETAAELLVVRQALETSLLMKVVPLMTPAAIDELLQIAHGMEDLALRGLSFADLDEQFHLTLFGPLRNRSLEGILSAFWTLLREIEDQVDVAVDPEVAAMHTAIVEAIAAGDYGLAAHELDTHFYGVRRRVVSPRLLSILRTTVSK